MSSWGNSVVKGFLPFYRYIRDKAPSSVAPVVLRSCYAATALMEHGDPDMFTAISIETTTCCNRRCGYCPEGNPDLRAKREKTHMPDDLYDTIIGQLADMGYRGRVRLHHYGEPLLDPRLEARISSAKAKLPDAQIELFTNGDLLTPQRYERLIDAGLDVARVTNHDAAGTPGAHQLLLDYVARHPRLRKHLHYQGRLSSLTNRAGLVHVENAAPVRYCIEQSYVLNVNVRGDVLLCCNDYLGDAVMGNVRAAHLAEIWSAPEFMLLRRNNRRGKLEHPLCAGCATGSA